MGGRERKKKREAGERERKTAWGERERERERERDYAGQKRQVSTLTVLRAWEVPGVNEMRHRGDQSCVAPFNPYARPRDVISGFISQSPRQCCV